MLIHESTRKWAESLKEAAASRMFEELPTIVYSSRTHSQLAQVMGELRNTGYRSHTHRQKFVQIKHFPTALMAIVQEEMTHNSASSHRVMHVHVRPPHRL